MSNHNRTGPHSSEHATRPADLGFDPDSPDVSDPQVDPAGPAKAPNNPRHDRTARENEYSPDFKSEPEKKPNRDADIDTDGG
ncbi:DUF6021 family protein [Pseudomonas sp. GD03860]|uniref:DUF6021 family protein n=1 Tax=Pseudomonas TaxID=286 RepID=UPI0023633D40|nr:MULTISPECIES: DUF6021 family protein [Pseudomonas]MDD2059002.1 DUF6021 family protein [Pseudomonas putida]MDH0639421.1 DUF6021 family protein [Pseudomonas sp. GD03860]